MKYVKPSKLSLLFLLTITLVSVLVYNYWTTEQVSPPEPLPKTLAENNVTTNVNPVTTEVEDQDNKAATEPVHNEPKTATQAEPGRETETTEAKDEKATAEQGTVERNRQLADRKGSKTVTPPAPAEKNQRADAPVPPTAPQTNTADTELNSYVLNIIPSYAIGNYPYLLNNDYRNYNGVTENLYYKGSLIAKAHPSGNRASHCSGITFEVFFKAMQARNRKLGLPSDDFNGMTFRQLQDFQMNWYVAYGNKHSHNLAVAVEKYGIGKQIHKWEEAKKGDFLDFSRTNNTGHTVVFLNWVRNDNGQIIGLHYWSSQGSTNGINYVTEYFDFSGRGNVISKQIYIARVLPVKQYK